MVTLRNFKKSPKTNNLRQLGCRTYSEVILTMWLVLINAALSGPDMTGRLGYRTMEINGRSTASYLALTPCVPLFTLVFKGLEAKGFLDFQGRRGITSVVRWYLRPVIASM